VLKPLHFTKNDIVVNTVDDYLNIPQNKVNFMILSKIKINYDGIEKITCIIAIMRKE
jgi:hypothetical protein